MQNAVVPAFDEKLQAYAVEKLQRHDVNEKKTKCF